MGGRPLGKQLGSPELTTQRSPHLVGGGGGFPKLRERVCIKARIHFAEVTRLGFSGRDRFLLVECTKSAAFKSENHAKLLEILAGEVAERLNAAVC